MPAGLQDRSARDVDLVCSDFATALDLLRDLGLRLDLIFPADEPHSAILSREGQTIRLTSRPDAGLSSDAFPRFTAEFVLTRSGRSGGVGRAGMNYRDLIPSRLGGRYIASHIAVPDGPVADWVHYHKLIFQLIAVRRGWVRLAYEGQGDAFVAQAGDLILQPPAIRHRVLESGDGLEVVEISCPALHPTFADHDMALPTAKGSRDRSWSRQSFLFFRADQAPWVPFRGGEARETGLSTATGGIADARWLRGERLDMLPSDGELVFGFVAEGSGRLQFDGDAHDVGPADSFVIPPNDPWSLAGLSPDFRLLHVTSARLNPIDGLGRSS